MQQTRPGSAILAQTICREDQPLRTIKKYPNRRLYDTEDSKYVTLAQVAELAKQGESFTVIDSESGKDITRSVLLQIILEQEDSEQAMFTADSLFELIRYYGNTVPGLFNDYFQQSLRAYTDAQNQLCKQFNADSVNVFQQMAKDNLDMWQSAQQNFLKMSSFGFMPSSDKTSDDTAPAKPGDKTDS